MWVDDKPVDDGHRSIPTYNFQSTVQMHDFHVSTSCITTTTIPFLLAVHF